MTRKLKPDSARALAAGRTRERIRQAALLAFVAGGYDGANLRVIASVAKATVGSLFNHFPGGKADLWRVVMGREPPDIVAFLQRRAANDPEADRLLRDLVGID